MKWKYLTIFFLILSIFSVSGQAKTIDFKEFYYDYQGNAHEATGENLTKYPKFLQSENVTDRFFTIQNDTISLSKDFDFIITSDKISPSKTFPKSQLASRMVNYNATVGYLVFPYSLSRIKDYSDEHNIKLGRWHWDNGITVIGENDTNLSSLYYDFKIVNDEMRLYFNKYEANKLQGNITFQMNSWTVDNSTFWNNTDCGSGYWSAYGGGSCGTPLSDSVHANLSGYWDMESTSGTTEYGINRYSRFPNTSIKGTWNGNTTLNYTSGRYWGTAANLDGTNDFIDAGNDLSLNLLDKIVLKADTKDAIDTGGEIISRYLAGGGTNGYALVYVGTSGIESLAYGVTDAYRISGPNISDQAWHVLMSKYQGSDTTLRNFVDTTEYNTGLTGTVPASIGSNIQYLYIGYGFTGNGYFKGSIDEALIIQTSDLLNSTPLYSTSWNMTFPNNTASAGNIINAVKFNISNLNVQGNTANISARQNNTANWTLINSSYVDGTWLNQTFWNSTDFKVDVYGNGSSRAFIISMTYDEGAAPTLPTYILNGTVNNSLGATMEWVKVSWDNSSAFSNESGFYEFTNASSGSHTLTAQQIGYATHSETYNLTANATKNITLSEADTNTATITAPGFEGIGILFIFGLIYYYKRKR